MNAQYRLSFATGALLAVLGVFGAADVAAEPVQGTIVWGTQDNCVYQFQNGVWYRQDICRVMQGRSIYSTYRPSTGQWLAYYDESQPGWIKARVLTDPNAALIAFPTAGGRNVMMLVNNQWIDLATWQQRANRAPQSAGNGAGAGTLNYEIERQRRAAEERRQAEARKADEESYLAKKRDDKYHDQKRIKEQQIERDRQTREANARAQANKDTQRALDEAAAARRREQSALDAQAAARRKADQAAADRAAAERRARNR